MTPVIHWPSHKLLFVAGTSWLTVNNHDSGLLLRLRGKHALNSFYEFLTAFDTEGGASCEISGHRLRLTVDNSREDSLELTIDGRGFCIDEPDHRDIISWLGYTLDPELATLHNKSATPTPDRSCILVNLVDEAERIWCFQPEQARVLAQALNAAATGEDFRVELPNDRDGGQLLLQKAHNESWYDMVFTNDGKSTIFYISPASLALRALAINGALETV